MWREMAPFILSWAREGVYLRVLPMGGAERVGVTVQDLTPQLAEYFSTKQGVLITSVRDWSPADRAGLRAGDVVTGIDGSTVRTVADLTGALHRDLVGAELSIAVTRDRRNQTFKVLVR
jgi:serine protease Do